MVGEGRSLDLLVAEKVFGWSNMSPGHTGDDAYGHDPTCPDLPAHGRIHVPHYSTSIADAWKIVEILAVKSDWVSVGNTENKDEWACVIGNRSPYIHERAKTAPVAICRAALKAVEQYGR